MVFKINISDKGKTFKVETESELFIGKKIGDKFPGNEILPELSGYELEIRGTSDKAGFPGVKNLEGLALRKVLFKKGPFLRKTPHKGFRRKKSVRGNEISQDTVQINCVVSKTGNRNLNEIFLKEEVKK